MKNLDNKHLFEAVTIIVVLYKSTNIIFECLKNLRNFKIVIVDNGRNETILEEIRSNNRSFMISTKKIKKRHYPIISTKQSLKKFYESNKK